MSRGIKLVLMGVAGAALLYSCSPGIGAGLGALPYLWFFSNPFYRGPAVSAAQHRRAFRDQPGRQQGLACPEPARRLWRHGRAGRLVELELKHAP